MFPEQQQIMIEAIFNHSTTGQIAIGFDMAANEKDWGLCVLNVNETDDPLYLSARMNLLLPQPRINASGSISPTLMSRPSEELLLKILQIASGDRLPTSVAVDVPFGWPVQQSNFLQNWSAEAGLTSSFEIPQSKQFAMRLTDRQLQQRHRGVNPLSVGADRIAAAALRWACVRQSLVDVQYQVDFGLDRIEPGICMFETYPGAFVKLNAPEFSDYKKKPDVRCALVEYLLTQYEITFSLPERESLEWACEQNGSPDALDAFLCALTAWDHIRYRLDPSSVALTTPERVMDHAPDASTQEQIRREGWILVRSPELVA